MPSPDRQKELPTIAREGSLIANKYRVERVLGHGGMGVVVAAADRRLGQRVAIKILYPTEVRKPGAVARFLREAQAAAALQNEHVVRILDFGRTTDGLPFMVMEHLNGSNLSALVASRGALPVEEAMTYLMQASEAVAEAHARGIVHRDIKLANLFLTSRSDGSPLIKVLDFGISKADWICDGTLSDLTASTETLGTPLYMSPEQIRSTKSVTARTDIWALGVVLYELLAGAPPFWAESLPALYAKIVADPPEPLSHFRMNLPKGIEESIIRCLDKDPDRRPASVRELAQVLSPFAAETTRGWVEQIDRVVEQAGLLPQRKPSLSDLPVEEAEVPPPVPLHNFKRAWLGLALGVSVAVGVVWWRVAVRQTPEAPVAREPVDTATADAPAPVHSAASMSPLAPPSPTHSTDDISLDAGSDGSSPAIVSPAATAPAAASMKPRIGAPTVDPLGDRY